MLDRIQQANPDTLAGIFGDVAWGNKDKLPEHALLNLIEAFDTLDLAPVDGSATTCSATPTSTC